MQLQPWTGAAARDWRYAAKKNLLTEAQVREIRASAESNEALAGRYGIGPEAVRLVKRRKTYRWVENTE